jgi:ubiquinone/menaquinone biosynthesis C-methylase UbiE
MSFIDNTSDVIEDLSSSIRESYNRLAEEYTRRIYDELRGKPLDRSLLDRFVEEGGKKGEVCDMGCGPGHVTKYLHDHGADVFGLDISSGMLKQARTKNPDIRFEEGSVLNLPIRDGELTGIVSFYMICNFPDEYLSRAFYELVRVLKSNGILLLAFHVGDKKSEEKELWGRKISLNFYQYQTVSIKKHLEDAGFTIDQIIERDPYSPDVEYQSKRAYVFARKL